MITRRSFLGTAAASALPFGASAASATGPLRVSDNRRFLVHSDGKPFFYLGDTAWELFHRLKREDAATYLDNRAQKGFNVVQAVVLAELDGLKDPNPYGHVPLIDTDPDKPNPAYFEHVDWVVAEAGKRGLYIGMLPTWGNKVVKGSWEKTASVIFNPENARRYGRWIGARYKSASNLIWILGGDREPRGVEDVWRAMAAGVKEGDGGAHLITFHPSGGQSSADVLHSEPWLDFNMMQSGHGERAKRNDLMIERDYARTPIKPVLDGEPRYENHPVNWKPAENGWFDEYDVRQALYWSVFAGGCGVTYGCHDIWQMLAQGRQPVGLARGNWKTSLDLPGARQAGYLRSLMESRPFTTGVPDQSLIAEGQGEGSETVRAIRGDGYAFVYLPTGRPVTVRAERIALQVKTSWFDPRTARVQRAADGPRFTPPGTPGRGNDWVLVIDDSRRRT